MVPSDVAESDAERRAFLEYTLPKSGHVRLHRMWAFAAFREDLRHSEHIHILYCEECRLELKVCLQTDTFGAVLKKLNRDDDTNLPEDDPTNNG